MVAYATEQDVAVRWRPLSSSDAEWAMVGALLEDASDMIRVRWPDIDERVDAGAVGASTLTRIVSAMVRRAMMNRGIEGVSQQMTTAGPFQGSATYSNPDGNLYLTAQEVSDLSVSTPRSHVGWLA